MQKATIHGIMLWANSELDHIGRIAAVEDPDIQYAYALSTVNGMLHLCHAVKELVENKSYQKQNDALITKHSEVVRVLRHLIADYRLDLNQLGRFNNEKK